MKNSIIMISHYGAYGIIKHEEKLLLVCKSRGPYKGLLDLPGGKIEGFESTEKTLKREIKKETGLDILKYEMVGYYECSVPLNETREMHHRGMIYEIQKFSGKLHSQAKKDVSSARWHNLLDLKETKLTPFAWQAVQMVLRNSSKNSLIKESFTETIAQ